MCIVVARTGPMGMYPTGVSISTSCAATKKAVSTNRLVFWFFFMGNSSCRSAGDATLWCGCFQPGCRNPCPEGSWFSGWFIIESKASEIQDACGIISIRKKDIPWNTWLYRISTVPCPERAAFRNAWPTIKPTASSAWATSCTTAPATICRRITHRRTSFRSWIRWRTPSSPCAATAMPKWTRWCSTSRWPRTTTSSSARARRSSWATAMSITRTICPIWPRATSSCPATPIFRRPRRRTASTCWIRAAPASPKAAGRPATAWSPTAASQSIRLRTRSSCTSISNKTAREWFPGNYFILCSF